MCLLNRSALYIYQHNHKSIWSNDNGSRKASDADDAVLTTDDVESPLYFVMLNVPPALSHIMGSELTLSVGSFVVSRNNLHFGAQIRH